MFHNSIQLLALERTGWRRWIFGRWVYRSEPFRRDIQRKLASERFKGVLDKGERYYPKEDEI